MNHTDKEIKRYFRNIFGVRIRHLDPYKIALTHKSVSSNSAFGRVNNERLEYLGDAILGAVMADFLYHKYPMEAEGVLTRMRSKLVNRNRLNSLGRKLGLHDMMSIDGHINGGAANGNAFEAVVGAIYLDQGFKKTYNIIVNKIFLTHLDMETVYEEDDDYKSRVLIWAQRNKHKLEFVTTSVDNSKESNYKAVVMLDGQPLAEGLGLSIKKAEQAASEKSLHLIEDADF